jgi:tetratricopeptide (TPR) repeat protein
MTFVAARCLFAAAEVAHASGDRQEALGLLRVWAARPSTEGFASQLAPRLPEVVRIALALDDVSLARSLAGGIHTDWPLDDHARTTITALLAEAGGDIRRAAVAFADAAQRWHDFGVPYEEAQALLGQGRCLLALGTAAEAAGSLTGAREVFERLGAAPALVETEALLATVTSSPEC